MFMLFTLCLNTVNAQCTPQGDPAVFGNNVWNVYAWNAGGVSDVGTSWNTNYSGYYVDTNLNFNSQSRWSVSGSPSDASGYSGCTVGADNHSWSAKRTGFPSGYYVINIPSHDDEAQLFVNGANVWQHDGCCDSHGGVWIGFLCSSSSIEFRVTEGGGGSYGSISFDAGNPLTASGTVLSCSNSGITLSSVPTGTFLWSTGETTSSISVSTAGTYSLTVTNTGGCGGSSSGSVTIVSAVQSSPTATLSGGGCVGAGNLSVTNSITPQQIEWKRNGITVQTDYASYPNAATVFGSASGAYSVCSDDEDNIYVADFNNNQILKWTPGSNGPTVVAGGNGPGNAPNQLNHPAGVFVDHSGNIYITDQNNYRVQKWAPGAGSGITVAGGNGSGAGNNQFSTMFGLCTDNSGNIYITDWSRIMKWAPGASSGTVVAGGNGFGSAANQLNGVWNVALDHSGNIYAVDYGNHRIQEWMPGATSGITVAGGNGYGFNLDQVSYPRGLIFDKDGNMLINCYYSSAILKWTPGASSGTYVCGYCCTSSGAVNGASGLAMTSDGTLYTCAQLGGQVVKFVPTINTTFSSPTVANYAVVETTFKGCTVTSNTVTVYPFSTINITGNPYFCIGGSTTLDAGTHDSYSWSTGGTTQTENFNTAGNYSITVTDHGCASTNYFYVASQTPVVNISPTPSTICINNISQLNTTLTSGGVQYATKTYYIDGNHLNGMGNSCGAARSGYWYINGQPGFTFADSGFGMGTVAAIKVEFNVGAFSNPNVFHAIYINNAGGAGNGSFTVPYDNDCSVNPANFVSTDLTSMTGYVVGATNTITLWNNYYFGLVPSQSISNYYARVTVRYQKPAISYSWAPSGGTVANPIVTPAATTTYTLTTTSLGCGNTFNTTVTVAPAPGDTSVFGNNAWNVYAFNAGGVADTIHAWRDAYSGYYVDTNVNLNSQSRWNANSSPSGASGYNGCVVGNDNHSWFAKRQGFPCGTYQIDIPGHDDAAELWVNGGRVWQHIGCCDSHTNVWNGFLDANSTVEFKVTEGSGASYAQINFVLQNIISLNGPSTICPGYSLQLTAGSAASYLWSTGATTQSISVNAAGNYSVNMTTNGCTHSASQSVTVTPLDTPAIYSYSNFEYCPIIGIADLNINDNPRYSTITWSTGEVYPGIGVTTGGNYSVTVSDALGCSATSHAIVTGPPGADTTFGNNVWKVNAYLYGDESDYGYSWLPQDYSGYYTDSSLNFNSQNMWNQYSNPSTASNYQGCEIWNGYMSWSAKRQGFPCGVYQVDVLNHKDLGQLFVDGVMVWNHDGCCDSHTNVWTGALNLHSKVEFRVTSGYASYGALQFTLVNSTSTFITVGGNQFMCTGQSYTLTSIEGTSYAWSNGETTNPIHASQSGSYSVTVTDANGCSLTSDPVSVTILPNTAPVAHITASSNTICDWNPVTLSSASISGNQWSTTETSQHISVTTVGDYSLTVTNNIGCSDQATIHLGKGFTPPTPSVSNNGAVCQNSSVNLTASGLAPGGQAASFNGYTQYINVHQDIPESNFTIEMWVKTTETETSLFSATDAAGNGDRGFFLLSGQLCVLVSGASDWNSGFTINDGQWHHIALVVQTGVGQTIYVDGVSSGVGSTYDHSSFTSQTDFRIGSFPVVWFGYFKGQIDNVRIWSEARTQTDIRNNMLRETPSSTTNLIYKAALNGNVNAFVGTNGTTPGGISYVTPDYFTYSWTGIGAPAASTSETQTISSIGTSGTYNVAVTAGGCSPSPIASTDVTVTPLINYFVDADSDGYGSSTATAISSCTNPGAGYVINNSDCNDANTSVHPGATEVCNSVDDNCNGQIDEGVTTTFYQDADVDGYGNASITTQACSAPGGYVSNNTDCNDANANVNPAKAEVCNNIDDNCNGQIDEGVKTTFYRDADGDGYGNVSITTQACTAPSGYVTNSTDCNDGNGNVNPGKTEVCNNIDDNCNGQIDEGVKTTFYRDADGDGYGNPSLTTQACSAPSGYVNNNTDCNDARGNIHPGASETCNNIDDNCNGQIDENVITASITPSGTVSFCSGGYITLTANNGTGISYQWMKNGVNISGATKRTYTANASGNYQVKETKNNCSAISVATMVNVIPLPSATITPQGNLNICQTGSVVLQANIGSGLTYQWMKGSSNISGATNSSYTATTKGNYKVVVTSSGCSKTSPGVTVTKSCRMEDESSDDETIAGVLNIYPNPTTGIFVVDLNLNANLDEKVTIQLYNSIGQLIQEEVASTGAGKLNKESHLASEVPGGLYLVRILAGDELFTKQLIIQR